MDEERFIKIIQTALRFAVGVLAFTLILGALGIYLSGNPRGFFDNNAIQEATGDPSDNITFADSIHVATGFFQGENVELVIANCTGCHSSRLIIQNRATKEGWLGMIKWMQETQNLPDLGENEEKIIDYLATYYAPENQGRRKPLTEIQWYELE